MRKILFIFMIFMLSTVIFAVEKSIKFDDTVIVEFEDHEENEVVGIVLSNAEVTSNPLGGSDNFILIIQDEDKLINIADLSRDIAKEVKA